MKDTGMLHKSGTRVELHHPNGWTAKATVINGFILMCENGDERHAYDLQMDYGKIFRYALAAWITPKERTGFACYPLEQVSE